MTRFRAVAALAAATCTLATAVAVGAAPAGAAPSHGNSVHAHTTKHHLVVAPRTAHPGIVRLHNSGNGEMFVLGSNGRSARKLAADLNASAHSNGPGRLVKDFVLRDVVGPHQTVFLALHHGTIYLADAGRSHYTVASIHSLRVTGKTHNAALPASRPLLITHANNLHVAHHVRYHGVLHVVNHSSKVQGVFLIRISASSPKADVAAFVARPTMARFGKLHISRFEEVGVVGGHRTMWTPIVGSRGQWAVVTFAIPAHIKGAPTSRIGAFSLS